MHFLHNLLDVHVRNGGRSLDRGVERLKHTRIVRDAPTSHDVLPNSHFHPSTAGIALRYPAGK